MWMQTLTQFVGERHLAAECLVDVSCTCTGAFYSRSERKRKKPRSQAHHKEHAQMQRRSLPKNTKNEERKFTRQKAEASSTAAKDRHPLTCPYSIRSAPLLLRNRTRTGHLPNFCPALTFCYHCGPAMTFCTLSSILLRRHLHKLCFVLCFLTSPMERLTTSVSTNDMNSHCDFQKSTL